MSGYTITTSSELMENYIQADFLLPQEKFIALQTDAGASLLFSIGTGGVFNLTIEAPGQTHGWRQVDLGAVRIQSDFGGKATVKSFGAAQVVAAPGGSGAQIHLAMIVNDGIRDHLYLSLGNSDSDLGWTAKPAWTAAPFNAIGGDGLPITPPSPLLIANVFLSEATDKEYVVVDTLRNPTQPVGVLARYYIDAAPGASPTWRPHDLAIDVQASGYASCLGRAAHAYEVDGLYTKGAAGASAQLVYTPLYNVFNPALPAPPSRLNLPGGLLADAIAAVRDADNTSDLYAAANGGLYWFASGNQKDGATGVLVASHPLLAAVRALYAYAADGAVTVWGLNGDDQVFYLTCPAGRQGQPAAWNRPLPILAGVDAIAPFIDRGYSANTFFAHTGTGLIKLIKSPTTALWTQRRITLPPSATTQPSLPIHSYTTHIRVADADGRTAPNVSVKLTATNVTSVSINHLYYIIGPSPIEVLTDALGTVTIVETATSLTGTRFQVSVASQPEIPVNTMDAAWARNARYTTTESLRSAQIVDRKGNRRDFVPAGTSKDDLDRVAYSNRCLAKAYDKVAAAPPPGKARPALFALPPPRTVALSAAGIADGIAVDIGDLFNWLATGVEAAIQLVEDTANDVWLFVATIGEAVYHGVLDAVEAVVAAATWVYNAIKVIVDDIILFLQFLFEWPDILVTHKVLKTLILRLSQSAIAGIETVKADLAPLFQQLQTAINGWADIPDFNQTAAATLASNPPVAGQNSAPANLGVHHFQNGCASSSSNLSSDSPATAILQDLVDLFEAEGQTLAAAATAIKTDIIDQFGGLGLTEIIKRLVTILADTVLQSAQNVLVTVLDILAQLMEGAIEILTAKLDIPVLSWLYNELTDEDLSFLDLICLIAAIPVTIIYKAVAHRAPFPKNDAFTKDLIGAKSFADIQALFVTSPRPVAAAPRTPLATAAPAPVLDETKLKTFGFVTGVVSLYGALVLIVTSNVQRVLDVAEIKNPLAKTYATIACLGNIAYVSPNIATLINARTDNWYAEMNNALTAISILKGIAAIPAAASSNPWVGKSFALVETCINIVWNVPVVANVIVNHAAWDTTYKSLIPETIGNLAFNGGGILDFFIAIDTDLKSKAILAGTQGNLMLDYGLCMIIAGGIYEFASDQKH
ncbi:hypothetical protein ASD21_12660 [Caulobacter sp. Root1455]|uniref:hypothetical protein n=1 Tax=Caulobacter sp. Root1455 TaxID=1736465 RepID=UPI0006F64B70|nr:hypothetical protein [Caulobacter sp. Root1455]KQY92272.1 hypothetical protein ASD21_12660 [Caulobacter sp. Root1455]